MTVKEAREVFRIEGFIDKKNLKGTYHHLAAQHHPDKGGDVDKFQEINRAYKVLLNSKQKCPDCQGKCRVTTGVGFRIKTIKCQKCGGSGNV